VTPTQFPVIDCYVFLCPNRWTHGLEATNVGLRPDYWELSLTPWESPHKAYNLGATPN
jgi:hypothetical protein